MPRRRYALSGRIRFATICDVCDRWIEKDEPVRMANSLRDGVHAVHAACHKED